MKLQALRFPPMLVTFILLLLTLLPLLGIVMTPPHEVSAAAPEHAEQSSQGDEKTTTPSDPLNASGINESIASDQLRGMNTEAVETYWNRLMKEYGGFFPDQKVPSFMEMVMPGGEGLKLTTVLAGLLRYVLHEVLYNGKLLVTIVILTVFSMMLETMQTAFERNAVSKVAYSITYMVMIVLAVNSFNVAIGYARDAITGMIQFMMAMVPLLLTLLATMGSVVTVSCFIP